MNEGVTCPVCAEPVDAADVPGTAHAKICHDYILIQARYYSGASAAFVLRNPMYKSIIFIGNGLDGIVVSATNSESGEKVALKLPLDARNPRRPVHAQALKTSEFVLEFIPRVHGSVEFVNELTDSIIVGVEMDLVLGREFANLTELELCTTYDRAVLFADLLTKLEECHVHGLVHGDLEGLRNIIISPESLATFIDFGESGRRSDGVTPKFDLKAADIRACLRFAKKLFPEILFDEQLPPNIHSVDEVWRWLDTIVRDPSFSRNSAFSVRARQMILSTLRAVNPVVFATIDEVTLDLRAHPEAILRSVKHFRLQGRTASIKVPTYFGQRMTAEQVAFTAQVDGSSADVETIIVKQNEHETLFDHHIILPDVLRDAGSCRIDVAYHAPDAFGLDEDEYTHDFMLGDDYRFSFTLLSDRSQFRSITWALRARDGTLIRAPSQVPSVGPGTWRFDAVIEGDQGHWRSIEIRYKMATSPDRSTVGFLGD